MGKAWCILLTVALLSGCLSTDSQPKDHTQPNPSGSDAPQNQTRAPTSGNWDPGSPSTQITFTDCQFHPLSIHANRDEVQALLPDGYEAVEAYGSPALSILTIHHYDCEALVRHNLTIIAAPKFAFLSVPVRHSALAPEPHEAHYRFEAFTGSTELEAEFEAINVSAVPSQIAAVVNDSTFTLTITTEDLTYDAKANLAILGAPESTFSILHLEGSQAIQRTLLTTTTTAGGAVPYVGSLMANGGTLGSISSGTHSFVSFPGPATLYMETLHD